MEQHIESNSALTLEQLADRIAAGDTRARRAYDQLADRLDAERKQREREQPIDAARTRKQAADLRATRERERDAAIARREEIAAQALAVETRIADVVRGLALLAAEHGRIAWDHVAADAAVADACRALGEPPRRPAAPIDAWFGARRVEEAARPALAAAGVEADDLGAWVSGGMR